MPDIVRQLHHSGPYPPQQIVDMNDPSFGVIPGLPGRDRATYGQPALIVAEGHYLGIQHWRKTKWS